jgi:hypothetical protein
VIRPLGRTHWLVAAAAALAVLLYAGFSAVMDGPGFPLDDGWIHQTYARNLARDGSWSFVAGTPSAGSTSPLWTLLLLPAHLLGLPPVAWTFLLGAAALVWAGWASMALWDALWPRSGQRVFGGLAVVLAWPLVWAAGSGMETVLFAALGLHLSALYLREGPRRAVWLGLGAGTLMLVRPEGLLLLLLLAAGLAIQRAWRALALYLLLALLPLLPYFALNLSLSGELWPNTFYAKQAEYAALLRQPLWRRLLRLFYQSVGGPDSGWRGISGARLLLLPGLLWAAYRAACADWQERRLAYLLPLLWAVGHVAVYAWRLPVTYQHGRYLLGIVPVWILFGLHGWVTLLETRRSLRVVRRAAALSYAVMLVFFLLLGAQAYATDVAFIENEMVATARWLEQNTPEGALVAAHDIGAIGYYGERHLLDLAGLISPEIIPLLADQEAMAAYVRQSPADYLVTAPGWPYTSLTAAPDVTLLYTTGYEWTRIQGSNNMAVYRLHDGEDE